MRNNQLKDTEAIFRAMREMLLEASPGELDSLAREDGIDLQMLSESGKNTVKSAIAQCKQNRVKEENAVLLHKGLNSLLIMLRRRDNLDESELALKANVEESEIRRIEFDP